MHSLLNESFTAQTAEGLIAMPPKDKEAYERNTRAYEGDYWQDGKGYLGPMATVSNSDTANRYGRELIARIRKLFCSKNTIKEVIGRQVFALLSHQPAIAFTIRTDEPRERVPDPNFIADPLHPERKAPLIEAPLTEQQESLITEATEAVNDWLQNENVMLVLRRILRRRLLGKHVVGRLFVPEKFRTATRNEPKTLADALACVVLDEPLPEDSAVDLDVATRDKLSVVKIYLDRKREQHKIEIGFVDDNGRTFAAILQGTTGTASDKTPAPSIASQAEATTTATGGESGQPVSSQPLPDFQWLSSPLNLNEHLLAYEMRGDTLITNQVWSLAASLNLALTMSNYVLVDSGFSELALTNVDLETEWIDDPTADGGRREVARPIKHGPGIANNYIGVEQVGPTGQSTHATPGIHWKEPTPVDSHIGDVDMFYEAILQEVHQLHALISGDATASGESRKQALADFVAASLDLRTEVEAFGRWLIETVLYLAAGLLGKPEYLTLRGQFNSKLDVGSLSSDEQAQLISQVEKKLRSKKSARQLLGIEDDEAEAAQIRREEAEAPPPPELQNPNNPNLPKPANNPPANPPANNPSPNAP